MRLWQRMDPETGKNHNDQAHLHELKNLEGAARDSASESELLLQIFLNCKNQIKRQPFEQLLNLICERQAKTPLAGEHLTDLMKLDLKSKDSEKELTGVTDKEKLQKVVDYDIVPELELYLHQLVKDIEASLDNDPTEKSAAKEEKAEEAKESDKCVVQRIREHVDKNKDLDKKLDELTRTETKY